MHGPLSSSPAGHSREGRLRPRSNWGGEALGEGQPGSVRLKDASFCLCTPGICLGCWTDRLTSPHQPQPSLPLLHNLLIQKVPPGKQQDGQGQSQALVGFIPPPLHPDQRGGRETGWRRAARASTQGCQSMRVSDGLPCVRSGLLTTKPVRCD